MARGISYEDAAKQRAHEAVDFGAMAEELRAAEACSQRLGSPVVWSHNDLLSGNILVSRKVCGGLLHECPLWQSTMFWWLMSKGSTGMTLSMPTPMPW